MNDFVIRKIGLGIGALSAVLLSTGCDGSFTVTSPVPAATTTPTTFSPGGAPAPTITVPASSPVYTQGASLAISGTCVGAQVSLTGFSNQTVACVASTYSFTVNAPSEGVYVLVLTQEDSSGAFSASNSLLWLRKNSVSIPLFTSPAPNPYTSADPALALSGSCETGATVTLVGPAAPAAVVCAASTFSLSVPNAADGDYTYSVSQTDGAGNSASAPATFLWHKRNLTLTPSQQAVSPGQTINFVAGGGSGSGYVYSISTNQSGGSINSSTGVYVSGTSLPKVDTISITDSLGVVSKTTTVAVRATLTANVSFDEGSGAQYTFDSSKLELVGGVCRLKDAGTIYADSDNTGSGFGGATSALGVVWDGVSAVKLGSAGGCDATTTNCFELAASWTPHWADLAAYWNLDEAAGTVGLLADSSGNSHPGTLSGSATVGNQGKLGTAASFDGSMGEIGFNPPTSGASDFTIAAWINTTTTYNFGNSGIGRNPVIAYGDNTSQASESLYLYLQYPGWGTCVHVQFDLAFVGGPQGSICVADGLWHHIAVTNASGTVQLYVDGQPDGGSSMMSPNITAGFGALSFDFNGNNFTGSIDEVAVWGVALAASDIRTIYARQNLSGGAKFTGTLASRVFDAGSASTWDFLSWASTLPTNKELPSGGHSETAGATGYSALASSSLMTGIVGLWHFNETATGTANGGAADYNDDSGHGNYGTGTGGVTPGVSGRLNKGVGLATSGGAPAIITPLNIDPATYANVTIAGWINPTPTQAAAYAAIVSNDQNGGNGRGFGISNSAQFEVSYGATWTPGPSMIPGVWQHVAVVYTAAQVSFFFNGVEYDLGSGDGSPAGAPFTIGSDLGTNGTGNYFSGAIDEVAVWGRALSATEIQQLYWRGANRIRFQVRSCSESTCTTGSPPWVGPDGTSETFFSELYTNTAPFTGLGNVTTSPPNQVFSNLNALTLGSQEYFQYQAVLETDDAVVANGPKLKKVASGNLSFDATSPTISYRTPIAFFTLSAFNETLGANGCAGVVHYEISTDDTTWYAWSGAAWVQDSVGAYASANTAADIGTNIATFSANAGNIYVQAFLPSNGSTPCEIDNIGFTGLQ